jgi:hypothetical protein
MLAKMIDLLLTAIALVGEALAVGPRRSRG